MDYQSSRRSTFLSILIFAASAVDVSAAAANGVWFDDGRLVPQASQVIDELHRAETYGLDAEAYRLPIADSESLAVLQGKAGTKVRQRFEAALSEVALRFVSDLHRGRVDPRSLEFQLPAAPAAIDADAALRTLASSHDVATTIRSFEPTLPPYRRLEAVLAAYRPLAADPTLTKLPALPARSISAGDAYSGTTQLRRLLTAVGDLAHDTPGAGEGVIDEPLIEAVRRFQQRHGLAPDGVIGPRTFSALTTPLQQRVRQIELSMERWRWLSAVQRPDIVVNIPQFMLFALPRRDQPANDTPEMRVIVGQAYPHTRTPIFSSQITQVVFQPYWDVPRGILVRELLPQIEADPSYLDRHDMEIVRGEGDDARVMTPSAEVIAALAAGQLRLRQRPGPRNALGRVKFVMPNPFSVYLHATPEEALFERAQRTFSHGCIRVSEPAVLAAFVLENAHETWSDAAIEAALCGTQTLRISLAEPVRVVVFYTTAVATRDAGVMFFDDVYGHDRKLNRLLELARRHQR